MQPGKYISYEIKFIFATNMLSAPSQGIYFRRKADLPILTRDTINSRDN